ncbi:hypothetical protein [Deinococcus aquatilis]|uniref:hypothetical protein n=1 Tax=Deinococcus aquatilis TaxID=519440 RepID=UPI00036AA9C2|nr:hypothetical protein [Deinococcus aquatilis]
MTLARLLSLQEVDWSYLDALVTEQAVAQTVRQEGHHVGTFGFWAVRRRARRKDPYERILHRPKDWTWLVFSSQPPPQLSAPDSALLARLVHGLHGVQYIQWTPEEDRIRFTSWSLSSAVVRGAPVLSPGRPRPEGHLSLPPGPLLPDLSRWASVPEQTLQAALVEAAYVERVAPADHGAFTNVDVVALAEGQPVAVEVKRRIREATAQLEPLTLTDTQAGTLDQLAKAGVDVHVVVRMVPPNSVDLPIEALSVGHWQVAASPPVVFGMRPDVTWVGRVSSPTLEACRQAKTALNTPAQALAPANRQPKPAAVQMPARPARSSTPHSSAKPRSNALTLKGPRRLSSFTFEYAFLRVWSPAPVKLGGRVYANPAVAFLAARTLDEAVRTQLSEVSDPAPALRVAIPASLRPDWPELRDQVAWAVLRSAYRGERGAALVATLPLVLADSEVWHPVLDGLQGQEGLALLSQLRGDLAQHAARQTPGVCFHCRWARKVSWPGLLHCAHPDGVAGTLACVGRAASRGSRNAVLVAVTTPAGPNFISKQAADRS